MNTLKARSTIIWRKSIQYYGGDGIEGNLKNRYWFQVQFYTYKASEEKFRNGAKRRKCHPIGISQEREGKKEKFKKERKEFGSEFITLDM
jgi:hypothetical protein